MESSKNKIVGLLKMRGLSIKDFAEQIGEKPDTVRKVLERATNGSPMRGERTLRIWKTLQQVEQDS